MRYEADKFKTCQPEQTVARIRTILRELGVQTTETWVDTGVSGCYGVRVEIDGMHMGQNGKGTTQAYALASGYAELMERLQTGFLFPFPYDERTQAAGGFRYAPDEVTASPERLAELGGSLLRDTLRAIARQDKDPLAWAIDPAAELKKLTYAQTDGKLTALPFCRLSDGISEYLPQTLYQSFYFTNGSCAGNSRTEALIQGMSEIAERYASSKILREKLTPPTVPEARLREVPSLYQTIRAIRALPEMELRIMDASCGMGLPVIASAVIDRRRGCYLLRFGSHPRFEVALERSITEILQGRHIRKLNAALKFDFRLEAYAQSIENRFSFAKAAQGIFPTSLFSANPSWNYCDFAPVSEQLEDQYAFLTELLTRVGGEIYVRDCSFLGFPTFHILVPAMSMVYESGRSRYTELKLHEEVLSVLRDPSRADAPSLERLERFLRYKSGWHIENTFSYLARIPMQVDLGGILLDANGCLALLALHRGERREAARLAHSLAWISEGSTPFYALSQLLEGMEAGHSAQEAADRLRPFVSEEQLAWAMRTVSDPLGAWPRITCYSCENCAFACQCGYAEAARLRCGLKKKMISAQQSRDTVSGRQE